MKIRTVEFAGAVARPGGPKPRGLPEVAFSGRSNIGKSSLINRLLGRTRTPIARVSGTPGKTQEVNFYRVDALAEPADDPMDFFLVDLPGYGYARVPKALRGAWKPLIEHYLKESDALRGVIQLIDVRHDPTDDDLTMLEFIATLQLPALVVLTKVDKLKRSQRERKIGGVAGTLGLELEQIVPFSAQTGEGREVLLEALQSLLREDAA